eukprot:scaffold11405_cov43-Cyclotella_meneghiniana.AAC.1
MDEPSINAASQLMLMRQEMMDSLRAELRGEFQSRENEIENLRSHVTKLANEFKTLQKINIHLNNRCEALEHTNATILQKQLIGETKIYRLEEQVKLLQASKSHAERKATYQE